MPNPDPRADWFYNTATGRRIKRSTVTWLAAHGLGYCPQCNDGAGGTKPLADFTRRGNTQLGKQWCCRECHHKYNVSYAVSHQVQESEK